MELKIINGDYRADGAGGLERVTGREELLQRVIFKLMAHRESCPLFPQLGSRLWRLGRLPAAERSGAAAQYAAEALLDEKGVEVRRVELRGENDLWVELFYNGETFSLMLETG